MHTKSIVSLTVLALSQCIFAHEGPEHSGPAVGETMEDYAQRHVSQKLQSLWYVQNTNYMLLDVLWASYVSLQRAGFIEVAQLDIAILSMPQVSSCYMI